MFDFLYNFYLTHFLFQEEFSEVLSQMRKPFHVKYPLFLSDFNETSIFWTDFRKKKKKAQISSFIKNRPVGVELFHADGQMDMKLTVAFHNFGKAPKTVALHATV